jgi:hypothetical protein
LSSRRFSLLPFTDAGPASRIKIEGEISRVSGRLAIQYDLWGALTEIAVPMPADLPARKTALWEETCFELFIAARDSSRYLEFNLSPAGHWNVFRFAAYRKEMHEDSAFGPLPFSVRRRPGALSLSLEIDSNRIFPSGVILDIGISAVIKYKSGQTSYWALSHTGQQPDFHRRDSFVIGL